VWDGIGGVLLRVGENALSLSPQKSVVQQLLLCCFHLEYFYCVVFTCQYYIIPMVFRATIATCIATSSIVYKTVLLLPPLISSPTHSNYLTIPYHFPTYYTTITSTKTPTFEAMTAPASSNLDFDFLIAGSEYFPPLRSPHNRRILLRNGIMVLPRRARIPARRLQFPNSLAS
jgi:hypothetical protein